MISICSQTVRFQSTTAIQTFIRPVLTNWPLPTPRSIGCCTTPTWCRRRAIASGCRRTWPGREWRSCRHKESNQPAMDCQRLVFMSTSDCFEMSAHNWLNVAMGLDPVGCPIQFRDTGTRQKWPALVRHIDRSVPMKRTTGDQQPAEEPRPGRSAQLGPITENDFTFGEVQWTSSLHSSATRPTSEDEAPAQSESGDAS